MGTANVFFLDANGQPAVVSAATPLPTASASGTTSDSTGLAFNPDACTHAYGYTGTLLTTDTATDPATGFVRVKTYTYTGQNLSGESLWVKQ